MSYRRNPDELKGKACKWWPEHLVSLEKEASIIPILIESQDRFISILTLTDFGKKGKAYDILEATDFPANLFLKHLMVLSDFSGEMMQRVNKEFDEYFINKSFEYALGGKTYSYKFTTLPTRNNLTNQNMHVDNKGILRKEKVSPFYKDLFTLLLFGGNAIDDNIAGIFSKCIIGNMLGDSEGLKEFIKQRYIYVSRITGGAKANDLGSAAQIYVKQYIQNKLGDEYSITSNGHIPGVSHNQGRTLTTFDLVVGRKGKFVGIEISFQVTTNSTIERKSGQAQARYNAISLKGHFIAYIIDGAGNFQRSSALTTICSNSHCTVAYTDQEFDLLSSFIKEKLNG